MVPCEHALSFCSTTITTAPQLTSPVATTGAPVQSTNATVTTRMCSSLKPAHRVCIVTTTNLTWSADPEGGASQTSTVENCLGPDGPGSCVGSAPGAPSQIAQQCGTTATSCSRTIDCQALADMSGAKCTVGTSAEYAVFCTSPQGADPNSSACQAVVNFSCADPPGALPANCNSPQYVAPKSDSKVLSIIGVALGLGGGSNVGPGGATGGGGAGGVGQPGTSPISASSSTGSVGLGAPGGAVSGAPSPSRLGLVVAARGPAGPSITLTTSAKRSVTGRRIRLLATVTPVPAGGTVRFVAGGRTVPGCGAVKVNTKTGQAACVTSFPVAGRIRVLAIYSRAAGRAAARSTTLIEVVSWSLRLAGSPSQSGGGATRTTLACASGSGGCRGTIVLTSGNAVVGRAGVALAAGQTRGFTVPLSASAKRQLASARSLPVQERVVLTAAGRQHVVAAAKLSLTG